MNALSIHDLHDVTLHYLNLKYVKIMFWVFPICYINYITDCGRKNKILHIGMGNEYIFKYVFKLKKTF